MTFNPAYVQTAIQKTESAINDWYISNKWYHAIGIPQVGQHWKWLLLITRHFVLI